MTETDDTSGSRAGKPLGAYGERVVRNVAQFREAQRLSYRELSERLTAVGRPIPEIGLYRMERGKRRVDADDLVALAVVFGVTPNRLLLSDDASDTITAIQAEQHRPFIVDAVRALLVLRDRGLPLVGVIDYVAYLASESQLLPNGAVLRSEGALEHGPADIQQEQALIDQQRQGVPHRG